MNRKPDLTTVRGAVARAREEGLAVTEYSLRAWIRTGQLPVAWAGNQARIYYPNLLRFLRCEEVASC